MRERHLWTRRAFRTRFGNVPCRCAPAKREHALFSELIPRWLARPLRAFVEDVG